MRCHKIRTTLLGIVGGAALALLTACDPPPEPIVVNSTADAPDAAVGDGLCETAEGTCTLRAAVMEANASDSRQIIDLDPDQTYELTISGAGEDGSATGDLDVQVPLTVRGRATIDGAGTDRVFDVHSHVLALHGTTVTGGSADEGAGIRVAPGGALQLAGAEIQGNTATSGAGGIHSLGGSVTVVAGAVNQNVGGTAGAVHASGAFHAYNLTVSGNSASAGSGAIAVAGLDPAVISFATITENAGDIGGVSGPVQLTASVVAQQAAGPDCETAVSSAGHNADGDASCLDGSGPGDQPTVEAALAPLAADSGPARSHLPLLGSPLVDAIPVGSGGCGEGFGAIDQRVAARPFDGDGDGEAACDIGAIESAGLVVDHGGDAADSDPGDGLCQDLGGPTGRCSLRAALQEAGAGSGTAAVSISPAVGTIPLTQGELIVEGAVTIRGNGATIDAQGASRVIGLASGSDLTLERVVVTGGRAPTGGGIHVPDGSSATIVDSSISDNESTGLYNCGFYYSGVSPPILIDCTSEGGGAGIWSDGELSLSRSTVSDNHSVGAWCVSSVPPGFPGWIDDCHFAAGAGIHLRTGAISDSTISGNVVDTAPGTATGTGSAISANGGAVTVSRSTIVDNGSGPQVTVCCEHAVSSGTITVQGSIIAGSARSCLLSRVSSLGYNLVDDSSCGFYQPGDEQAIAPALSGLQSNGGPTDTHLPLAHSPAVDSIPSGTADLCDASTPPDQRGVARPQGSACDRGSVEREHSP